MIADLKPYPTMQDSAVPWLGRLPEHWSTRKLRHCGAVVGGMTPSMESRHFWDGDIPWVTPKDMKRDQINDSRTKVTRAAIEQTSLRIIPPPAVLLVVRGMILARRVPIAWTSAPVTINQDMKAIQPLPSVSAQFLTLMLDSAQSALAPLIDEAGHGTRRLPSERWRELEVTLPPLSEQLAIIRFLDDEDRRIRRYIGAKQKLIRLLEEQKQAIIHRAVTRGLDPNVPLKPSGVGWLGAVPHHWEVLPLRRLTISRCDGPFGSGLKSAHYSDHGVRVIRLQNIGHARFKDSDAAFISFDHYAALGDHSVEPGDVLVAGLGDERHPAGRACVAPQQIVPAMVKADCFRFRLVRDRLRPDFAAFHLTATAASASAILSAGATRQRTNLQATAARTVAVPPIDEQAKIVAHLDRETASADIAVSAAEREITLLREYRVRLIADVVTGKLDVREAAAKLLDEADEPEALDEMDALTDSDEAAVDDAGVTPEDADS